MRTFKFSASVEGKITIPDAVLKDIRNMAAEEPGDGGPNHLNRIHKEFYEDDDAFLQAALKNALRGIVRAGLLADLGGLGDGVGFRVAPAQVEVSVPEQVVTKVKDRKQITSVAFEAPHGKADTDPDVYDGRDYPIERVSGAPDLSYVGEPFGEDGPASEGFSKDTPYNRAAHSAALAGDINPIPKFGVADSLEQADPDA